MRQLFFGGYSWVLMGSFMTEVDKNDDIDHHKNCCNCDTDPENRSLDVGIGIWCSWAVVVIGAYYHQQKIYQNYR